MGATANIGVSVTARTKSVEEGMARSARSINKLSGAAKGARSNLSMMGDRLKLIAGTGVAFGGVYALGRWVVSIEQFNQAMHSSLAIMGKLSAAMKGSMTAAALQVASVTKFSATEVAGAYYFLASAGLDAKQSLAALPAVAQFAQAGMFSLATATSLLTDAQAALGLKVKDATQNLRNMVRVSDILVKANTLADASVEQFARALASKAGAKMKVFNIDIEEGVAVLAAFAEAGLKAELGGRAFAIVVRDLTRAAVANREAFEKWDISVFDDLGALRDLADILEDVEKAFGGASTRGRAIIREQLGLPSRSAEFLDVLTGSSEAIREFTGELKKAGKTTKDVAEKQRTEFGKGLAEVGAILASFGRAFQPLIDLMGKITQSLLPDVPEAAPVLALAPTEGDVLRDAFKAAQRKVRFALAEEKSAKAGIPPLGVDTVLSMDETGQLFDPTLSSRRADAFKNFGAAQDALRAFYDRLGKEENLLPPPLATAEEIAWKELAEEKREKMMERIAVAQKLMAKEWKGMERATKRYFDATRTEAEQLAIKFEEIDFLGMVGLMDDDLMRRAMAQARWDFEEAMGMHEKPKLPEPQRSTRPLSEVGGMQGAIAISGAIRARNKELDELQEIRKSLQRMERRKAGMGA